MTQHHEGICDWMRRSTGSWTSQRRYLFGLKRKEPINVVTEFSIAALTEGEHDFQVTWEGQTSGVMNLKLLGNELHRDIGYYTDEPTVSLLQMIDSDTLVMSTTYGGRTFREEIRFLDDDKLRLRQTVGWDAMTGECLIVGQYFEQRLV